MQERHLEVFLLRCSFLIILLLSLLAARHETGPTDVDPADQVDASVAPPATDNPSVYPLQIERQWWAVERLREISPRARIALYLGTPRSSGRRSKHGTTTRINYFLEDPSLDLLEDVQIEWLADQTVLPFDSARELVELQVMTARNLYSLGRQANEQNTLAQLRSVRRIRDSLAAVPLFRSRAVVYAASYDKKGGREMFGRSPMRRALERQSQEFDFHQPDAPQARASCNTESLARSLSRRRPVTLFFEGHGRPNAVNFDGRLKASELADFLAAADNEGPLISIFATCFGHDYARNVLQRMSRTSRSTRLPIFVVPEEFGQEFIVEVGSDTFTRTELGIGWREATFGDLFETSYIQTSIYAPNEDNVPLQIL